jgi:MoxR-like ATPase
VHDALKRRCLYQWIDYPSADKERRILEQRVPGLPARLGSQIVDVCQKLRRADLYKVPGVAESIDWACALRQLDVQQLDDATLEQTLGCVLKHRDDVERVRTGLGRELLSSGAVA